MSYTTMRFSQGIFKDIIEVKKRRKYMAQTTLDGYIVRLYRNLGSSENDYYQGVLFRPDLEEKDYPLFRTLMERTESATGQKVPHEEEDYMEYLSEGHWRIWHPGSVEVQLTRKRGYISHWDSYLRRSRLPGFAASIAGVLGLTEASIYLGVPERLYLPVVAGLFAAEMLTGLKGYKGSPCGPLHAIGYIPTYKHLERKLKNPDFFLDRFMRAYEDIKSVKGPFSKQRIKRLRKKLDKHFEILREEFKNTDSQRGLSIGYTRSDKNMIYEFFESLITGKKATHQKQQPQAEEDETEEVIEQEPFRLIDPWSVDIPEIKNILENRFGGKK